MWGSDYPHAETNFPRSRQILEQILARVPEEERRQIICINLSILYHFDLGPSRDS